MNYVEPSEDDIYRRPRGVSYAEPGEDGKRASREHVSRSDQHSTSCCGYCGDQFPQEQGVRKVT